MDWQVVLTFLNDISTVVVTVATVVLAGLTFMYVRLTKHMVDDMKRSKEPAINVDFELVDRGLRIVIINSGLSSAKNIQFEVKKDISWIMNQGGLMGVSNVAPIENGVSYLVPGRTFKYRVGIPRWKEAKDDDMLLSLHITFIDEVGKHYQQDIDIDMSQYKYVLYESFKNPSLAIAEAIENVESRRRSREQATNMFGRFGKKTCPACCEIIKHNAKKCFHCGEWIEQKDADDIQDEDVVAE